MHTLHKGVASGRGQGKQGGLAGATLQEVEDSGWVACLVPEGILGPSGFIAAVFWSAMEE